MKWHYMEKYRHDQYGWDYWFGRKPRSKRPKDLFDKIEEIREHWYNLAVSHFMEEDFEEAFSGIYWYTFRHKGSDGVDYSIRFEPDFYLNEEYPEKPDVSVYFQMN